MYFECVFDCVRGGIKQENPFLTMSGVSWHLPAVCFGSNPANFWAINKENNYENIYFFFRHFCAISFFFSWLKKKVGIKFRSRTLKKTPSFLQIFKYFSQGIFNVFRTPLSPISLSEMRLQTASWWSASPSRVNSAAKAFSYQMKG